MAIAMFVVAAAMYGISKAVADRTQHSDLWVNSVFGEFDPESFFGPKDRTWVRKYEISDNKFLLLLFKYPLVWLTDIWHFANAVTVVAILTAICTAPYIGMNTVEICFTFWFVKSLFFNLYYHIFTLVQS